MAEKETPRTINITRCQGFRYRMTQRRGISGRPTNPPRAPRRPRRAASPPSLSVAGFLRATATAVLLIAASPDVGIRFATTTTTNDVASVVDAAPASPHPFRKVQPDGSHTPELLIRGDQHYHYFVTVGDAAAAVDGGDGGGEYAVLEDDDGWYVYATVDESTGGLIPRSTDDAGRAIVGKVDPTTVADLSPGRRPSRSFLDGVREALHDAAEAREAHDRTLLSDETEARRLFDGTRSDPYKLQCLVTLLRFSDHADRDLPPKSDVEDLFNDGTNNRVCPTGSVQDVFLASSHGKFKMTATVTDWIPMKKTEAYYANNNWGWNTPVTKEAFYDALNHLDKLPSWKWNWNDFDVNNDGVIDCIVFVHSGYAAEWGGNDCTNGAGEKRRIWSHKSGDGGKWKSSDGKVRLETYFVASALWGVCHDKSTGKNQIGRIGVMAHEAGHFLGLDDYYDGTGRGIGNYCLMANMWGWDNSQRYPPSLSAYNKLQLNWATAYELTETGSYDILSACESDVVYKIKHNYPSKRKNGKKVSEYLLLENRHDCMYDKQIKKGSGLAVWHVDESVGHWNRGYPGDGGFPSNGKHYRNALLQCDGRYDLERAVGQGDSTDLCKGSFAGAADAMDSDGIRGEGVRSDHPNTNAYMDGNVIKTGNSITDIGPSGRVMSFAFSAPGLPPKRPPTTTATTTTTTTTPVPPPPACKDWAASVVLAPPAADGQTRNMTARTKRVRKKIARTKKKTRAGTSTIKTTRQKKTRLGDSGGAPGTVTLCASMDDAAKCSSKTDQGKRVYEVCEHSCKTFKDVIGSDYPNCS